MAAEEEAAGHAAQAGGKGVQALTRKLGPLPIWAWAAIGVAIFWYIGRGKGSSAGQATDPAGNVGTIDPATGYVYGSSQDQQALSSRNSDSTSGSGSDASTTAGQYADNAAWGRAAINYLVGLGVDPTSANEAIQQFLSSQTLTPQQQGLVNLAIQGIKAPPQLPGPTGTPPPPVTTPPAGVVYATNPPTGFVVSGHTASTISVKWNASTNATGYTVRFGRTADATDGSVSVGSGSTTATAAGLSAGTLYYLRVQATPAKSDAAFAQVTSTTDKAAGSTPPPPPAKSGGTSHSYTVKSGDTLIGIANKLHIPDWHTLYNNNKATIEAAAKSHGKSSSDGGHWIYPGTVLHY